VGKTSEKAEKEKIEGIPSRRFQEAVARKNATTPAARVSYSGVVVLGGLL